MSVLLAAWSLFSTWCRAHGYKVSEELLCGLDSRVLSTPFLVFSCFDIKGLNCFCWVQPAYSTGRGAEGSSGEEF